MMHIAIQLHIFDDLANLINDILVPKMFTFVAIFKGFAWVSWYLLYLCMMTGELLIVNVLLLLLVFMQVVLNGPMDINEVV